MADKNKIETRQTYFWIHNTFGHFIAQLFQLHPQEPMVVTIHVEPFGELFQQLVPGVEAVIPMPAGLRADLFLFVEAPVERCGQQPDGRDEQHL